MYSDGTFTIQQAMKRWAHRVFILCAEGHLEDEEEERTRKRVRLVMVVISSAPAREGCDVVSSGS